MDLRCPQEDVEQLLQESHYATFTAGEYIVRIGHRRDGEYLILSGASALIGRSPYRIELMLGALGAGEPIPCRSWGPAALPPAASFHVLALTDVAVARFPAARLRGWAMERGKGYRPWLWLALLNCRLGDVVENTLAQAGQTVRWRTAATLLRLRAATHRDVLPISQTLLATCVGVSREAVVDALRELRRVQRVRTGRGWIEIPDADALADELDYL